nr:hypothetical protein CFP56_35429 [Quercus suber]
MPELECPVTATAIRRSSPPPSRWWFPNLDPLSQPPALSLYLAPSHQFTKIAAKLLSVFDLVPKEKLKEMGLVISNVSASGG